jgi:hypothetical protein
MIEFYEVAPASAVGIIKSVVVPQAGRKQLVFKLTDDDGRAVDLLREVPNPPAPLPDWTPERQAVDENVTIKLASRAGAAYGNHAFNLTGTILTGEDKVGFVSFQITATDTARSGVFDATIGQFVTGDHLVQTWPVRITVEPNDFATPTNQGAVTIPDLRYALLDVENGTGGAPFNNLLDDTEFTDSEIQYAITRIVDKWNETPPPVCIYNYQNFPYRYWWIQGAVGELLLMGAARYRRNRLDYQAGGIAINDQSKADEYETVGRAMRQEFDTWMLREKTRINMDRCWGFGL